MVTGTPPLVPPLRASTVAPRLHRRRHRWNLSLRSRRRRLQQPTPKCQRTNHWALRQLPRLRSRFSGSLRLPPPRAAAVPLLRPSPHLHRPLPPIGIGPRSSNSRSSNRHRHLHRLPPIGIGLGTDNDIGCRQVRYEFEPGIGIYAGRHRVRYEFASASTPALASAQAFADRHRVRVHIGVDCPRLHAPTNVTVHSTYVYMPRLRASSTSRRPPSSAHRVQVRNGVGCPRLHASSSRPHWHRRAHADRCGFHYFLLQLNRFRTGGVS